jgi:hypothetical protein
MTRDTTAPVSATYDDLRVCQWVILLVAAGVLILEVAITRLFSVLMYYHFGFMAISLAMFGLGASGLWLFGFEDRYPERRFRGSVAFWSMAAAVSAAAALAVVLRIPITLEYSNANVGRLLLIYAMLLVPFFCAGMAIAIILFRRTLEVSRLYSWDLVGAAIGAVLTVGLLNAFGAIATCLVAAGVLAAAALLAGWSSGRLRLTAAALLVIVVGVTLVNQWVAVFPLKYLKGRPKEPVAFERWNAYSYITVQIPPGRDDLARIEIDADAATFILKDPFATMTPEQIRASVARTWASSLPHELADTGRVLIIGPGGGLDVVFALSWGARRIDAVELNGIIADDIMRGRYAGFSGRLYDRPEVNLVVAEGRSFVRQSRARYDHIQLTLVDTWAATAAGAFSLTENHLYTVEAFADYLAHLEDDGILSITRWTFPKPRETLRLMTTAFAAAERQGIADPARHIIIASIPLPGTGLEMASFIFRRAPMSRADHETVMNRLTATGGHLLYSPFERMWNAYDDFARAADRAAFIAEYEYNVTPATDDRPFFFNIIRAGDLRGLFALELESRKNNLGILNLIVVAAVSVLLVGLFFLGPLLTLRRGRDLWQMRGGVPMMSYFIAVGLGFILVEVGLIQTFVLFLGHPVHALTVILSALLVSAGAGALYSRRLSVERCRRYRGGHMAAIVGAILLAQALLPALLSATFALPLGARVAMTVLLLAPLGFLLGQPFPIGLKHVESRRHDMVPWAWGLNGAASVLGSVAAIALAMIWGYRMVVIVGAGCYLLAWLCLLWSPGEETTTATTKSHAVSTIPR